MCVRVCVRALDTVVIVAMGGDRCNPYAQTFYTVAQTHSCADTQLRRHTVAQTHSCADAQLRRHTVAQTHSCTQLIIKITK